MPQRTSLLTPVSLASPPSIEKKEKEKMFQGKGSVLGNSIKAGITVKSSI